MHVPRPDVRHSATITVCARDRTGRLIPASVKKMPTVRVHWPLTPFVIATQRRLGARWGSAALLLALVLGCATPPAGPPSSASAPTPGAAAPPPAAPAATQPAL